MNIFPVCGVSEGRRGREPLLTAAKDTSVLLIRGCYPERDGGCFQHLLSVSALIQLDLFTIAASSWSLCQLSKGRGRSPAGQVASGDSTHRGKEKNKQKQNNHWLLPVM